MGLLGYAFSNAIFGLASDVGGLFLAQLAQGIGGGLLWLAALAIVSDLAPGDCRGQEYGRVEEMSIRGMVIGTLVGFALLQLLSRGVTGGDPGEGVTLIAGWRILFFGFTAATLLAVAIVWRGVPESLQRGDDRPPKHQSLRRLNR